MIKAMHEPKKNKFLLKYLSGDPLYHLQETSPHKSILGIKETQYALGNGYIGSRGIYEENPEGTKPGTFITGFYESSAAQVEELVNLPNPIFMVIASEGEKFDLFAMKIEKTKRFLDMKNGSIIRETVFKDAKSRKFLYRSVRFFSMDNPHIGAMRTSLKLLNGNSTLSVIARVDDTVINSGGLMQNKRQHYNTIHADKEGYLDYILFRTNLKKELFAYADSFEVTKKGKKSSVLDRFYQTPINAGEEISFTKIFTYYTSYNYKIKTIKRETMRTLGEAVKTGFDRLYGNHKKAMEKRWNSSGAQINTAPQISRAFNFIVYHMLIAARNDYAEYSIGAKTLSGPGYKGHIFWDTEIYLLPFYSYTDPEIAKGLLKYRFDRLAPARLIAKEKKCKGAMFPWESASGGDEQTPRYSKNNQGSIIEVHTQDYEQHISADIAYGVYTYYEATSDIKFMEDMGLEMLIETARFWHSRLEKSDKDGLYHINNIMGPDEHHICVDDNLYTSVMAKWNIEYALKVIKEFYKNKKAAAIKKKLKVTEKELRSWEKRAETIYTAKPNKKGVLEQFKGYFKKRDLLLKEFDDRFLPVNYEHLKFDDYDATTLIKQPDVVILFLLFPNMFSPKTKLKNFLYYLPRTTHKSSLSYSVNSVVGYDLGFNFLSYVYFVNALNIDLGDVQRNAIDGIHAANLGGCWQVMVYGMAGVRIIDGRLHVEPRLPGNIKSLKFRIRYKSCGLSLEINHKKLKITSSKKDCKVKRFNISVCGANKEIVPGSIHTFNIKDPVKTIKAKDVMSSCKEYCMIKENQKIEDVVIMTADQKDDTEYLIVDNNGQLCGTLTNIDIKNSFKGSRFQKLKVRDIMNTNCIKVSKNVPIEDIIIAFMESNKQIIPVTESNSIIGIISRKGLIKRYLASI